MQDQALPLHFLMYDVDARDGVSRSVTTLANQLSATHPVEIISLYRRPAGSAYPLSTRVRVTYLFDRPPLARDAGGVPRWVARHPTRSLLSRRPSLLADGRNFPNFSLLTDLTLARRLRSIRTGVLISTRPVLHVAAARLAQPGVLTVGQDHLNFLSRSTEPGSMDFIEAACRRGLDAFVTLTPSDAADYRRELASTTTWVTTIPNALSWPVEPRADEGQKVIVAAGRLVPRKGMARLIKAFAPVAHRHPDWELHIHGDGPLEEKLHRLVGRLGLAGQVHLLGHTDDLPAAFDEAAFFASGSFAEGFPMVMLEALSKGLPLVSFDCPRGPGDIIRDGKNGLLVPNGDIVSMTEALETVIADGELRRAMGEHALADAEQYLPDRVAASWEALLEELRRPRSSGDVA